MTDGTALDPQIVREIAQKVADIALHDAVHVDQWISAVINSELGDECKLMRVKYHTAVACRMATVKPSWPAEQAVGSGESERAEREAVERLWTFLEFYGPDDEIVGYTHDFRMNAADLRAALERLRWLEQKRDGLLAHAYGCGWYDAIQAYRTPGWDQREAGWREFREQLKELDAKAAALAAHDGREAGA